MTRKSFVQGALILATAGFINRLIGFAYRIISVRIVGPEGIGLFEMVFPIYTLILVITTAGVPLAISKLVSEQVVSGSYAQAQKIFRTALGFLIIAGTVFVILLLFLTPVLVRTVFADPRVYWCLITLAPAIIVISISSAFRGYFQGLQQMLPPAISQVLEQVVRVGTGTLLAFKLLKYGIEFSVAGLAAGTVLGEVAGFILLFLMYTFNKSKIRNIFANANIKKINNPFIILVEIFKFSVPISASRLVNSTLIALQAMIIPQRLQVAGHTFRQATEIYGQFSGIALALLGLPTIITFSLATSLVPAISEATSQKNQLSLQSKSYKAIQISLIAGLPAAVMFYLLPDQLCSIIFGTPGAGTPLRIMAFGSIFLYLTQTTSGILQGLGLVRIQLRNSIISALFNIVGIYYLTGLPGYGIKGTALAMNVGWGIMAVLNLLAVFAFTGTKLSLRKFCFIPAVGTLIMGIGTYSAYIGLRSQIEHDLIVTVGSLVAGGIIYIIYLFASRIITVEDMAQIPGVGILFQPPRF